MKTVEQLGLSQTPWQLFPYGTSSMSTVATNGDIETADGRSFFPNGEFPEIQDARMMKAAPNLYEAGNSAYDALEGLCPWYGKCVRCLHRYRIAEDGERLDPNTSYCDKSLRKDCIVYIALSKLRAALAEAAGEDSAI